MQRLFENKKTAYTPEDLYMKPERIRLLIKHIIIHVFINIFFFLAAELMETYQEAKTTCFFTSEKLLVSTKRIIDLSFENSEIDYGFSLIVCNKND